jgi:hypothetical protein
METKTMGRKKMQTQEGVAKDAKTQAEHAQKEVRLYALWIKVKKQKGAMVDRVEVMNSIY